MDFPENPYMQILHHATPAGIVRTADISSVNNQTRAAALFVIVDTKTPNSRVFDPRYLLAVA
jgi:hypothetical protein